MLDIIFNYDFDTEGFFSGEEGELRRETLEEAASFYENFITDNLLEIAPSVSDFWTAYFLHPATGELESVFNPNIPEDTIIIYAGGRDFVGALGRGGPGNYTVNGTPNFEDIITARGQTGALASTPTDVSLWGGALTFDTNIVIDSISYDWHNSFDTEGLDFDEIDFFSITLHELGHILGIGTLPAWENQISGNNFIGAKTLEIYRKETDSDASYVPLHADEYHSHWSTDFTSFDVTGTRRSPVMRARGEFGTRSTLTNIDYAALKDIGWSTNLDFSPIVSQPITDLIVPEDADNYTVDLSNVFLDPDDEVTFSVQNNSNTELVSTVIEGDDLNLNFLEQRYGEAEITIRAAANGQFVDDTFTLTVPDASPIVSNPINNLVLTEEQDNYSIDLSDIFLDPNDDEILFSVQNNSNTELVLPVINSNNLNLNLFDNTFGTAEITIRATANEQFVDETFTLTVNQGNRLNTPIYRFQSKVTSSTYLFVGSEERQNIQQNFTDSFMEEGVAFNAATIPSDELIPLFRFQNNQRPGTYLFVGESERNSINNNPNFSNSFTEEGIAFYVYSAGAKLATPFFRFQNSDLPGTYLYATGAEADNIRTNFPNFVEEGIAFEAEI